MLKLLFSIWLLLLGSIFAFPANAAPNDVAEFFRLRQIDPSSDAARSKLLDIQNKAASNQAGADGSKFDSHRDNPTGSTSPSSGPQTGSYGALAGKLAGTGLQANHLNQNAAYKSVIPPDEGLANAMQGNAFTEPGTPHYDFHSSLEDFWDQYRPGGALEGLRPSNAEYGMALQDALQAGGYSPAEAADLAAQAAAQRVGYGLGPNDPVPRIPGRINQLKP